ncbi:non-canonical purine NTP pyrophosphatase, RdgB/HAM1 family [Ammoniphilus oxalaticus]|uniref:dITP/XTP pyrophosphatase n=1 Tax=Ammoniphilus oxalaticus TaxID=66863 RepID=A0A419SIS2_9BACL|nr:XTP/dITP diphosphatase [Ammoniphilus oxalaticus]RKD23856.1 non-canonical purine NTP pyrophosphatase, RdgB/HAM1 family [Ammoniphilus oxalaticus]
MSAIIVLATRNKGKIEELNGMLSEHGIVVKGLDDYPECPEIEEDGETFEQNAIKKAETVSKLLGLPALADDSGLEVDALDGQPGVYSARFAGLNATDRDNIEKLIALMSATPVDARQARFRCALAFAAPGQRTWTCSGSCEGEIVLAPRGHEGFGYDPIFYLPERDLTMAQLTEREKNKISHRGEAVRKFVTELPRLL